MPLDEPADFSHGRIMPAHDGVQGHPFGPFVYVLIDCNGGVYGPWTTLYDVAYAHTTGINGFLDPDWLEPKRIPIGSLRLRDIYSPPSLVPHGEG
jgi:hypothetical protein